MFLYTDQTKADPPLSNFDILIIVFGSGALLVIPAVGFSFWYWFPLCFRFWRARYAGTVS
jgi:hypothetical protein